LLYNYSPPDNKLNWLQDFLTELVKETLSSRVAQIQARSWTALMPAKYSAQLKKRYGIRKRYQSLTLASQNLTTAQASNALSIIANASTYNNTVSSISLYNLNVTDEYKDALKILYEFGFGLLSELQHDPDDPSSEKIRDKLYKDVYKSMPGHLCPFCGIDRFDAPHPDMPRHALDHYLAISLYPIFGAHLPNLVPMCGRCNSSFKLAIDMLKTPQGVARACVYPYGQKTARISLRNSAPFGSGQNGQLPNWQIDFVPNDPEFKTWDDVFKIRFRYKESLLDAEYKAWLGDFAQWAQESNIAVTNNQEASEALAKWASICPAINDYGFLKKPMFEMLAATAQNSNATGNRLTGLVKALCSP
jgi:hypothetical protein